MKGEAMGTGRGKGTEKEDKGERRRGTD